MIVTSEQLRLKHACKRQVRRFENRFGKKTTVTLPKVRQAGHYGLNLDWYASMFFGDLYGTYCERIFELGERTRQKYQAIEKDDAERLVQIAQNYRAALQQAREWRNGQGFKLPGVKKQYEERRATADWIRDRDLQRHAKVISRRWNKVCDELNEGRYVIFFECCQLVDKQSK